MKSHVVKLLFQCEILKSDRFQDPQTSTLEHRRTILILCNGKSAEKRKDCCEVCHSTLLGDAIGLSIPFLYESEKRAACFHYLLGSRHAPIGSPLLLYKHLERQKGCIGTQKWHLLASSERSLWDVALLWIRASSRFDRKVAYHVHQHLSGELLGLRNSQEIGYAMNTRDSSRNKGQGLVSNGFDQ